MSEEKWAIITGADGGMGTEITRAVAAAGYHVIMACYHPEKAELVRQRLVNETGNTKLEVIGSLFGRSDFGTSSPRFFADE